MCDCDRCCKKFPPRLRSSCISISFKISLFIYIRLWQMLLKNFACGGLLSLIYFNFVHDSIIFINYFNTTVTNSVKKFRLRRAFFRSCISISFKISLFICVRLWQILLKRIACGGLSSLLFFKFVNNFITYLCATVTDVVKNFIRDGLS